MRNSYKIVWREENEQKVFRRITYNVPFSYIAEYFSKISKFLIVEFDDGSIPTNFDSWRGSYCELALNYKKEGKCHIDTLYRNAFNANGSMFVGYKGGDFVMDLDTPIHQANYGECGVKYDNGDYIEKKIIGIKKENNKIIILTRKEED